MIIAIWAMDTTGLIGNKQRLPWHIKEEMEHFQKTTMGYPVLFGRKTYDTLPFKPLSGRQNIVITRNVNWHVSDKNVKIIHNLHPYLDQFAKHPSNHIFICGGSAVYESSWPILDQLVVTIVKGLYKGDVYFPKVEWHNWKLKKVENNNMFTIYYYERINTKC